MNNTTTDEKVFSMKWKAFLPLVFAVIITTNTATGLIFNQNKNTEDIEYNKKRADRRLKAAIELSELKQELKECINRKTIRLKN